MTNETPVNSNPPLDLLREHLLFLKEHQDLKNVRLSQSARRGLTVLISQAEEAKRPGAKPAVAKSATPATPAPASTSPAQLPPEMAQPKPASPSPKPAATPASPAPVEPVLTTGSKAEQMAHLRSRALSCTKCPHLVARRTQVVFGDGSIDAQLMFVGEAPGEEEDKQGVPFVGRAGDLLTKMIQAMGLARSEVYIGNVAKCRPDMPIGVTGNRKPTKTEMETCVPYLHAQINLIKPKVLVALGATAVEGLLNNVEPIGKLRGKFLDYRGIPIMPTYHPSYLLRTQKTTTEKRKVWEDLLQVMVKLEMPISEKQQNYFLSAL